MKNLKRILAILVVLAVCGTSTVLALDNVTPSVNVSKELVQNGGLESVTDGAPNGIALAIGGTTTATWAETLVTDSVAAHSGNNYFSANNKANLGMEIRVNGLTEGKVYELSFWYKASQDNATSVYIRHTKDEETVKASGYDVIKGIGGTGGAWSRMLLRFALNTADTTITGENGVRLTITSSAGGADAGVAFDDISLVEGKNGTYILNGDMESVNTTVNNWKYSGTAATADTETVHGDAYSMKLTSAGATSYATQEVILDEFVTNGLNRYEMSAYVNITALEAGSTVKLSAHAANETGTELWGAVTLSEVTGGWEKISYSASATATRGTVWLRISVIGTGTVYADDVKVEKPIIMNGGLEGKLDSTAALRNVYFNAANLSTHANFSLDTTEKYEGGGSLKYANTTTTDYMKLIGEGLEVNQLYTLTFRYKVLSGGAPTVHVMNTALGTYFNTAANRWLSAPASNNVWTLYTVPFTPTEASCAIRFYCQSAGKTVYFDDIRVQKAEDSFGFYDGESKIETITPALYGKTLTAKWSHVGSASSTPTMIAAVYQMNDNGTKLLVSLDLDVAPTYDANNPLQAIEGSVTVPAENGEYVIEAMFWDGIATLMPLYTKEVIN